jgi:hypothetical protein
MSTIPSRNKPLAQLRKTRLSPARQRLVDLLGHVHFGRVLDLHIRDGEPLFDPAPRVVRTVKLSGIKQSLPQATPADVALNRELVKLLQLLDGTSDGVIGRIEVAHGLPLFAEVHESATVS